MMKQEADLDSEKQIYLTCEKYYIFELLIFAAGMMGAYTFNLRGGVFCNAQTARLLPTFFDRSVGTRRLYRRIQTRDEDDNRNICRYTTAGMTR